MARYDTYVANDDRILEQADMGFIGFNSRLRPDQLPKGTLADSKNGRLSINGEWQTRRGIQNILAPMVEGDTALTLPFNMFPANAPKTVTNANITWRAAGYSGRTLASLECTLNGHGLDDKTVVQVSGLSVVNTVDSNGARRIRKIDDNTFYFEVPQLSSKPNNNASLASPQIDDSAVNAVYGSCLFSDPREAQEEYIVLAGNQNAIFIQVSNPVNQYTIDYPSGHTISEECELIQAFNQIFIFRGNEPSLNGKGAFVCDLSVEGKNIDGTGNDKPVFELVASGKYTQPQTLVGTNLAFNADGKVTMAIGNTLKVGDNIVITDVGSTDLLINSQFNVSDIYTTGSVATGTFTAGPNNSSVPTPNFGSLLGTFKYTFTKNNHGLEVGQPITIAGYASGINGLQCVSATTTNTFSFNAQTSVPVPSPFPSATVATEAGFSFYTQGSNQAHADLTVIKEISSGVGFTHMPAPSYGVYHQRRLCVPYKYNVEDNESTYTERKNLDEIVLSDLLDHDTYDQIYGQFRFNAGMSDFNVGMHSFSDDKLIVFNRNSIHIILNSVPLANSNVQLLTNEIGCLARKSIAQVGSQILFLSDNGVFGVSFQDMYNLRGNEIPLSESIQDTIDRVDFNHASKAVGLYHDNRYYLALPVGDYRGQEVNYNNKLIIYNFLNKSWESVDEINVGTGEVFEFKNLIVAGKGAERSVYVVNTEGGLHKLDSTLDGKDKVFTLIGQVSPKEISIEGSATTRMFTFDSIDRKKWNNFELHIQGSDSASDCKIEAIAENPDYQKNGKDALIDLRNASFYLKKDIDPDEDVSIRGRIGNHRAYGMQLKLTTTKGRPRLRAAKLAGVETFRSTSSVE